MSKKISTLLRLCMFADLKTHSKEQNSFLAMGQKIFKLILYIFIANQYSTAY